MTAASYGYGRHVVHPALLQDDVLSVGGRTFRYGDVASYALLSVTERDWHGQLLCAAIYGLASCLFLTGVLLGSLDSRFLIAVVFLAAIAMMSMIDALGTRPLTVYHLVMTLSDGRTVSFVDGDETVVDQLAARIDASLGRAH